MGAHNRSQQHQSPSQGFNIPPGLLDIMNNPVLSLPAANAPADQGFWPFPQRPKPPCSLRELAAIALETMPEKVGSSQAICDYIAKHFPFYRQNTQWHNTLKVRMGDKKYFIRQPKRFAYYEYSATSGFLASVDVENLKQRLLAGHHMELDG